MGRYLTGKMPVPQGINELLDRRSMGRYLTGKMPVPQGINELLDRRSISGPMLRPYAQPA